SAKTRREACHEFEAGLRGEQVSAWEKYQDTCRLELLQRRPARRLQSDPTEKLAVIVEARERLGAMLADSQRDVLHRQVAPYVEEGYPAEARTTIATA